MFIFMLLLTLSVKAAASTERADQPGREPLRRRQGSSTLKTLGDAMPGRDRPLDLRHEGGG